MTFNLKPISKEGIQDALEKAKRYRLLNEPTQAESICLDILNVETENHEALVILLLALTDQFPESSQAEGEAKKLIPKLANDYEKDYYSGIICERMGTSSLKKGFPGSNFVAYDWFIKAMEHFEKAQVNKPSDNDNSILRWNACARLIQKNKLKPDEEDKYVAYSD